MLVILALLPRYRDFVANISYYLPFGNSTMYATVSEKADTSRERVDWYNADEQTIEIILNYDVSRDERYKFVTTEHSEQSCYYNKGVFYGEFIPSDYDGYNYVGQTYIANMLVDHYQQRGEYIPPYPHNSSEHIEVRSWQRDFYTMADGTNRPMRWFMAGKSNYYSHYDYYIIDYMTFEEFDDLDANSFEFDEYNINGKELSRHCDAYPEEAFTLPSEAQEFVQLSQNSFENNRLIENSFEVISKIRSNKNLTFSVNPNQFAGINFTEFKESHTGFKGSMSKRHFYDDISVQPPDSIDYRTLGITEVVKDENYCGSCWAQSAAGCLEERLNLQMIKDGHVNHPLVEISAEQIIDCFWNIPDADSGSHGCNGGEENEVLRWWSEQKMDEFVFEHAYPYLGENDFCKSEHAMPLFNYRVEEYHDVPVNNVAAMKRALASGPVSVGIAIEESFLYYAGGVYNDPACSESPEDTSHAVVLVGYGMTEDFKEYWILKNSWSALWGVDGYAYIAMYGNICGILNWGGYIDIASVE